MRVFCVKLTRHALRRERGRFSRGWTGQNVKPTGKAADYAPPCISLGVDSIRSWPPR